MTQNPLETLIGELVVLDTQTPIVYIGKLVGLTNHEFVLDDVDMHDCRDGHANKEQYLSEAHHEGITVNRRKIVVMRHVVISISRLEDVVED